MHHWRVCSARLGGHGGDGRGEHRQTTPLPGRRRSRAFAYGGSRTLQRARIPESQNPRVSALPGRCPNSAHRRTSSHVARRTSHVTLPMARKPSLLGFGFACYVLRSTCVSSNYYVVITMNLGLHCLGLWEVPKFRKKSRQAWNIREVAVARRFRPSLGPSSPRWRSME